MLDTTSSRECRAFAQPDDREVERTAALLRLLADPTRLRLLYALSQGESFVSCLAELSGASQPAVSQHLTKLRLAGVIAARREGSFSYYAIVDPRASAVLALLMGSVESPLPKAARS